MMKRIAPRSIWSLLLAVLLGPVASICAAGFLQIKDGYFWDSQAGSYFVPRGIAYQVWNPPVGASQSFEQLDYDLLEFKKMHVNSVRCEMVWGELEIADGIYDWSKADYLVAAAERLGLRLFVLIGFQYPPSWFPKHLRGINAEGLTPDAMRRLAAASATTALEVFPQRARDALIKAVAAEHLGTLGAALVEGARSGSVSNVLTLVEQRLPPLMAAGAIKVLVSDVINYEHPEARAAYAKHLTAVTARYKNSTAIGGWILGNEYAYFDLWEDPALYGVHRFLGYDLHSQQAFREYLELQYAGEIAALNANWRTAYASFAAVEMPLEYPVERDSPAYYDLIQWRKKSIGDFVGIGTVAARQADPNHLQTYSMVGGIFSGWDANNTAEDAKTIVARCVAAGAPLDFWSINNYANAAIGGELRSADFGVGKYQAESGLPVMISETGHSSTENLFDFPEVQLRQAKAVPGQIWESLVSGAIGTHIFHWNDRLQYRENFFIRERGFGIVGQDRKPKGEVYTNVVNMFRRMHELRLDSFLGGSLNPPPDVQFFWSTNSDLVWPRANQENASSWGALKRLGYQPSIIDDAQFHQRAFTNAPVLLLSRAFQMDPAQLAAIATEVLPAGVHVHANADIPGQFDRYLRPNAQWISRIDSIFGVRTENAVRAYHNGVIGDVKAPLRIQGGPPLGTDSDPFSAVVNTWIIWHGVGVSSGRAVATHSGLNESAPGTPALIFKDHPAGHGKAALSTFASDDIFVAGPKEQSWDFRYDWLRAIYSEYFNVTPAVRISGRNGGHVIPDYRLLRNGSILVSFLNEGTNSASITARAAGLLAGRTVENLTAGGILERNSDGTIALELAGDDYVLLYAYDEAGPGGALHQTGRDRLWIDHAPMVVHPRAQGYAVEVGFETRGAAELSMVMEMDGRLISTGTAKLVHGRGREVLQVFPPDPAGPEGGVRSTAEGGASVLRIQLRSGQEVTAEAVVPVRLAWAVRPSVPLPPEPVPGREYSVDFKWEELPAVDPNDSTPLGRSALFDRADLASAYAIAVQLKDSTGRVAAETLHYTREGSGTNRFYIMVPAGGSGPLHWAAEVRPVTAARSRDVFESFEGNDRGAKWPDSLNTDFLAPWTTFTYADPVPGGTGLWQNEGVQLGGSHGSQSAFLVATNPPGVEVGLFGLSYAFPGGAWVLPADTNEWGKYRLSFDFMELNGRPAVLELQIKNSDPAGPGAWLSFSKQYEANSNGWVHVSASLDEFAAPREAPGIFDPAKFDCVVL